MQLSTNNSCSSYFCVTDIRGGFPKTTYAPFFSFIFVQANGNDFLVSLEVLTAKASGYVITHSHGSWLEHHVPSQV